jgi:ketosteroid isomerase-like protein
MNQKTFDRWLSDYGAAWEERDLEAAKQLFTPDALYYWTPFEEPKRGRAGIAEAWGEATSGQTNIHFRSEILAVEGDRAWCRWWCDFTRLATGVQVKLDGIFQCDFTAEGLCLEFREWWHAEETS